MSQLENMNSLKLELGENEIGNKGIKSFSSALIQIINLNCLKLDFEDNEIDQRGAEDLSSAIS